MAKEMNVVWVTYSEAEALKPFFKAAQKYGPWKEARESAGRILSELECVQPVDYSPLRGYQMFLNEVDFDFYLEAVNRSRGEVSGFN